MRKIRRGIFYQSCMLWDFLSRPSSVLPTVLSSGSYSAQGLPAVVRCFAHSLIAFIDSWVLKVLCHCHSISRHDSIVSHPCISVYSTALVFRVEFLVKTDRDYAGVALVVILASPGEVWVWTWIFPFLTCIHLHVHSPLKCTYACTHTHTRSDQRTHARTHVNTHSRYICIHTNPSTHTQNSEAGTSQFLRSASVRWYWWGSKTWLGRILETKSA